MSSRSEARPQAPPPWRDVFAGARGRLTAGLLLLEALVALEALIVATILPAVERDLGGLSLYGWTFSAFTLATVGSVPVAGRITDRVGPTRVLGVTVVLYAAGLLVAALAPSMLVLVVGRFVQGIGGGGIYTVSLSTVAKTYPDRIRPRVMALLASMWILPGLFGPPIGAVLAETVGWRWAFLGPIPAIALGVLLVAPSLSRVERSADRDRLPVAASMLLMVGVGLALAGLSVLGWWALVLIPAGVAIALPGLRGTTPRGTALARRGLPAAAAAAFLLSCALLAVDGFITLMLTKVRGLSVGEAGIVVTAMSLSWAVGSWWESRVVGRLGARAVTSGGALLLAFAAGLAATGLLEAVPVIVPYVGWSLGGFAMGVVFPTIPLSVMSETSEGREAGELSATILMDFLGAGVGAGLGNASVALADAGTISLPAGIGGAFAVGVASALLLAFVGRRIPDARPVDSAA